MAAEVDGSLPRIRELRQQRDMSVRRLAALAGVSAGMISQVERGLTQPSLETLRQIARALDVPLFSLLDRGLDQVAVVRAPDRIEVSSPTGIRYQRISPGFGRMELLEGHLPPGGSSAGGTWTHPAEECVVVTAGRLRVTTGDTVQDLAIGDSCYFDSSLPHAYTNPFEEETRYIVAITPPSF